MTGKLTLLKILIVMVVFIFSTIDCYANQNIPMDKIKEQIVKCAAEMGVEPEMALSIAKHESGFCQEKRSKMGAVGVFQLMPSTARRIGYNPYHYKDNIKGGISYYKQMKNMFKSDAVALAAYNAGPGTVKKYGGIPPYAETKKYVNTVMSHYNNYKNSPDSTVVKYLAEYKQNQMSPEKRRVLAEKEHREMLTLFMINQAI